MRCVKITFIVILITFLFLQHSFKSLFPDHEIRGKGEGEVKNGQYSQEISMKVSYARTGRVNGLSKKCTRAYYLLFSYYLKA